MRMSSPPTLLIASMLLVSSGMPAEAQDPVAPGDVSEPAIRPAPPPAIRDPARLPDERVRLPERSPEPTGVHGWVAIVDPGSGERWLPYDYEREPPAVRGYPMGARLRFEPVLGGPSVTVRVAAAGRIRPDTAHNAYHYAIPFEHSATMTGPPIESGGGASVRYNPAFWRLARIEIEELRHTASSESGARVTWSVDFEERAAPFPDLPDRPPTR